jgi:hypothetical protein
VAKRTSAPRKPKHSAPVLAFTNRKANTPPPAPAWPAEERFNQKTLRLAHEYPEALVEVEALIDDFLKYPSFWTGGQK